MNDVAPAALGPSVKVDTGRISLIAILNALLLRWRLLLIVPVVAAIVAVVASLLTPRFESVSSFVPAVSESSTSRLAGLAAQFGIPVGGSSASSESAEFYVDLLQSRDLLRAAVLARYTFTTDSISGDQVSGDLVEVFGIDAETREKEIALAIKELSDRLVVSADAESGIITVRVQARWPQLAQQINRRLLTLLDEFNRERRQSRASAERSFIERRMAAARDELAGAEAELERFLEANRAYQESPRLLFEAERLQRRVDLRQQVFTTLAQAYEQARIEEVRDTPVITVIDEPETSAAYVVSPLRNGALGLVLGLMLALGLVLADQYMRREREEDPLEFERLRTITRDIVGTLVPRALRRRLGVGAE